MAGEFKVPEFVSERPRTVVVNLFGGPGSGKTTAAFEIAEKLKKAGYTVEYAPECAKELVWAMGDEKADIAERELARALLDGTYDNQLQLYTRQKERVMRLVGQCDFVVTDYPPALCAVYLKPSSEQQRERFERMAVGDMGDYECFNMLVTREGAYEQAGRIHDPAQAAKIDSDVKAFLGRHGIFYGTYGHGSINQAISNAIKVRERVVSGREGLENGKQAGSEGGSAARKAALAEKGKVKEMAEERAAAQAPDTQVEYDHVPIPKTGYQGQELFREFKGRDGRDWIQVKMPPHTPEVMNLAGETVDISNRTFLVPGGEPQAVIAENGSRGVRTGTVTAWENDPGYKQVAFPKANREGEPWTVEMRMESGHWEHPEMEGKERGKWIQDGTVSDRIEVAGQLAPAMEVYRAEKADYAREMERAETRQAPERAQAKERGAQAKDAPEGKGGRQRQRPPRERAAKAKTPAADAKAMTQTAAAQKAAKAPAPKVVAK